MPTWILATLFEPTMRFVGRALVLAAFWVPLTICVSVAVTPDPTGMVASLSGVIAHIFAFAYLTAALFQAHFPWTRGGLATPLAGRALVKSGDGAAVAAPVESAGHAPASPAQCVWAAVLWMLAFGVAIEVAQLFVAGRSGDLADLVPDSVGIAIGCAAQSGWARLSFRHAAAHGASTSLTAKTTSAS